MAKHCQVRRHVCLVWKNFGSKDNFLVKNVIAKVFISGSLVVNSTLRPLVFQQIVKASDMVNGTGRYRIDFKCRRLFNIFKNLRNGFKFNVSN